MDEKAASKVLEDAMRRAVGEIIAFTVVSNPFIAMECIEHTEYDAIFISSFLHQDISAFNFLKIVRNVGYEIPTILLRENGESLPEEFVVSKSCKQRPSYVFFDILQMPYSPDELARHVRSIVQPSVDTTMERLNLLGTALSMPNLNMPNEDVEEITYHGNVAAADGAVESPGRAWNGTEGFTPAIQNYMRDCLRHCAGPEEDR